MDESYTTGSESYPKPGRSEPANRKPQIHMRIGLLEEHVDRLDTSIQGLEDCLAAVLGPIPDTVSEDTEIKGRPEQSAIAHSLNSVGEHVAMLTARIALIRERLEI